MDKLEIIYNQIGAKGWNDLLKKAHCSSFQQDWSYGAVLRQSGAQVNRIIFYKNDVPIAMVQIIERRFLKFFEVGAIQRGPVFIGQVSRVDQDAVLKKILKEYPRKFKKFMIIMPESLDETIDEDASKEETIAQEKILLQEKRRQVYTGYTTLNIDLTRSEKELWDGLDAKNRNMIRKAQKHNLKIVVGGYDQKNIDFILQQEVAQQKKVGYNGLPVSFIEQYAKLSGEKNKVITVFAYAQNAKKTDMPLAGAIFLTHGCGATYHVGWNGEKGRALKAMNLILWEALVFLKSRNFHFLDMGGINTDKAIGIARFKLGFGGRVKKLLGSYL